jgi:hypothetical protein
MECCVPKCVHPAAKLEILDRVRSVLMCLAHYAAWRTSFQRRLLPEMSRKHNNPAATIGFLFDKWIEAEAEAALDASEEYLLVMHSAPQES